MYRDAVCAVLAVSHTRPASIAQRTHVLLAPPAFGAWLDDRSPVIHIHKLARNLPLRHVHWLHGPSPTLSPTDPVPRGLLTLCAGWEMNTEVYTRKLRARRGADRARLGQRPVGAPVCRYLASLTRTCRYLASLTRTMVTDLFKLELATIVCVVLAKVVFDLFLV